MREEILKQYFDGLITSKILNDGVEGSETKTSYDVIRTNVDYLDGVDEFEVTKKELLKLCNDAITGTIKLEYLTTIGCVLEFSEYFYWDNETTDGKMVVNVITDWANPEINFPITAENMRLWKTYLESGVYNLK